jgi:hypothetical protein
MTGLSLVGDLPVWPFKIGASDPIDILLTVALVVFINVIIRVVNKIRESL